MRFIFSLSCYMTSLLNAHKVVFRRVEPTVSSPGSVVTPRDVSWVPILGSTLVSSGSSDATSNEDDTSNYSTADTSTTELFIPNLETNTAAEMASIYDSCASTGTGDEDIFLWVEFPQLSADMATWTSFYRNIYSFVQSNCARLTVTRLILRVTMPVWPLNQTGPWWPPNVSPMYTELISKLDSNVELYVSPYVMDTYNQQMWAQLSPDGTNIVEGIFVFVGEWNAFLSGVGSSNKFVGIVVDYEEIYNLNPTIEAELHNIAPLKAQYGLKTGISFGYQSWAWMNPWDSVMDEFYLKFYPMMPFSLYLNQPAAMVNFTLQTVLQGLSENTAKYGPKVNVMWSNQSPQSTNCIYPMPDGTCGMNWEFGEWSAEAFNEYLHQFRLQSPNLGSKPQGMFQFSFIDNNWFIRT